MANQVIQPVRVRGASNPVMRPENPVARDGQSEGGTGILPTNFASDDAQSAGGTVKDTNYSRFPEPLRSLLGRASSGPSQVR